MTEAIPSGRPHWTLDRRVPLALIYGMLLQTLAIVSGGAWLISELNGRVAAMEYRGRRLDERLVAVEARQQLADTSMARLEERLIAQGVTLERIERLLEEMRRNNGRAP